MLATVWNAALRSCLAERVLAAGSLMGLGTASGCGLTKLLMRGVVFRD